MGQKGSWAAEQSIALDRAGFPVFRDTKFLAAGPASERGRSPADLSTTSIEFSLMEKLMPTPAQKATATRKRRRAAAKAALTRKRRVAGQKAAATRKRRAAARKAAATRDKRHLA